MSDRHPQARPKSSRGSNTTHRAICLYPLFMLFGLFGPPAKGRKSCALWPCQPKSDTRRLFPCFRSSIFRWLSANPFGAAVALSAVSGDLCQRNITRVRRYAVKPQSILTFNSRTDWLKDQHCPILDGKLVASQQSKGPSPVGASQPGQRWEDPGERSMGQKSPQLSRWLDPKSLAYFHLLTDGSLCSTAHGIDVSFHIKRLVNRSD